MAARVPQGQETFAFEFAAEHVADPRAREAKYRLGACFAVQHEAVAQHAPKGGWIDFAARLGARRMPRRAFQYSNSSWLALFFMTLSPNGSQTCGRDVPFPDTRRRNRRRCGQGSRGCAVGGRRAGVVGNASLTLTIGKGVAAVTGRL